MSRHAVARRAAPYHRPAGLPRHPRRVSGPVPRTPRPVTGLDRVLAIPDSGLVDKLLRSRAWIWLIGLLLGGIVAMQVSLLKLNNGIGRAVESAATLERQNAELEAEIARLSSGDRIRAGALRAGMLLPEAGSVAYLTLRPGDARRAADRMQPPSSEARAVMERGGAAEPGTVALAAEPLVQTEPAADGAAPAPTPTPMPTPTPTPDALPPAAATGGAAPGAG